MTQTAAAPASIPGLRKAAILLVLLGDEAATAVYKHLSEYELHQLTQEIALLNNVTPEVADHVLREYLHLSMRAEGMAGGGLDIAGKYLTKALGAEPARALLDQMVLRSDETAKNFERLAVAVFEDDDLART